MREFLSREMLRKPLRLGAFGLVGCVLAALVGEAILAVGAPAPPKLDVLFVLDTTASMQYAIDGTRDGIGQFAAGLAGQDEDTNDDQQDGTKSVDARVGLIAFRDRVWAPPRVDVLFALDTTASMEFAIAGVRDGIIDFASELEKSGIDVRVGLVAFRDRFFGQEPQVLRFDGRVLTTDFDDFRRQVSRLRTEGNVDLPESSFDALALAAQEGFTDDAKDALGDAGRGSKIGKGNEPTRVMILITDAAPQIPDKEIRGSAELNDVLRKAGVDQLHVMTRRDPGIRRDYAELHAAAPGEFFSIEDAIGGDQQFATILPEVARQIATVFEDVPAGAVPDAGASEEAVSGEPQVLTFDGEPFTADFDAFREEVGQLEAAGGGDVPESSLDALALAARQPFRAGATRAVVLVTDAAPRIPDLETESVAEAADALDGKIDQLHLVVMDKDRAQYESLRRQADAKGEVFSLADAAGGSAGFETILQELGQKINVLQSGGGAVVQGSAWRVYLMYAAWTGLLGVGVALALTAAQNLEVQRSIVTPSEAGGALAGGFAAGAVASLAGQFLFGLLAGDAGTGWLLAGLGRLAGWTLLGAALGFGMSFIVPNLVRSRAALGGAIGGAAGALGYLLTGFAGDAVARLLGAAALGFCIGLMVALADVAFRHAWLDVSFGGKERSSVTLGQAPVTLGSDRSCTVWVAGAAPVALRYVMQDGQILCEDVPAGSRGPAAPGQSRQVGKVTATVRTSTSPEGPPAGAQMKIPAAPPPPSSAKKPTAPPVRPTPPSPTAATKPTVTTTPRPITKPATKPTAAAGPDRGPRLPPPPPPPKPK